MSGRRLTTAGVVSVVVAALLPAILFSSDAGAAVRPSKLAFATQPGDGTPGTALATQPRVVTTDDKGATVASNAAIALTLTGPGGAALQRLAVVSCRANTVAAAAGSAQFATCSVNRGGVYSFTATDKADSLSVVSADFFVSGPAQLLVTGTPGGAAGGVWASQPEVTIADGHGDPVTTSTSKVALAVAAGSGPAGAALTCTNTTVAAVSGVARYAGCRIASSGTGFRVVATDANDALISAPTAAFTVTAGTPAKLAFRDQPAGAIGGAALVTQPVVVVQDALGNTAVGNTDTVTLAVKAGTGAPGAVVSCDGRAAVDGVASFTGCAVDRAGTGFVLVATDSASGLSVDSAPFAVTAGAPAHLAFTTQPGGGPGGTAFDAQPVVRLTDGGGNPVPGNVELAIVPGTGTADARLACDANPAAGADGTATFSGCAVDATGTGYRLRASAGGLVVDSDAFDVSAGLAASAAFSTQPGGGTGGRAFATQPVVTLADPGGNAAAGPVTLAIAPGTGTPGATLTCASNPVSSTGGAATFAGCAVDRAGSGYRLLATSGTARRLSEPFDVTVGPAARLAFTVAPGGGTGGAAWAAQPSVAVQDAGGNLVPGSSATIALAVTSGTGDGALTCVADSLPAVRGTARFDGCAIDATASAYRLTASDAADGFTVTSAPFAVTPGPVAALRFTGQPGGANAGTALAAQPVVTAVDLGGNRAVGSTDVTLRTTVGTGSGGALSCATTTLTAAPTATFSGCAVATAGSGYTLTATAGALRTESTPFAVLLPAPTPLGVAPTDVPVAQTFGGRDHAVNPTNVVDGVNTATGAFTRSDADLTVAGIGVPFELTRTYTSADPTGGAFGPGWSSILDIGVTFARDGSTATVRGEDGQQVVFRSLGLGGLLGWAAPPGARSSLSCVPVLVCTVTRFDGRSFVVSGGHVIAYRSPEGPGFSFGWSRSSVRVTMATSGRTPLVVTAALDTTGRVTKVTTPTRAVSYGYTAGLLTSVTDAVGATWSYGYSPARLLTSVTDPLGQVRRTVAYDGAGRVVATTQAGSAELVDDTFAYAGGTTTRSALADVQGTLTRVDSTDRYVGRVLVQQTDPVGATTRYSYDAKVQLTQVQDPMGWVRQLSYDAAGNLVRVADPISSTASAVVSMTYDGLHRLRTQTDANGATTTYDHLGSVLTGVRPPGVNPGTQFTHNLLAEVTGTRTSTGRETYTYDAAGNRTGTRTLDLRGNAVDGRGTLVSYDEAGHELRSVDPRGNLAAGVDPTYATTWTYDGAGRQLTQSLPGTPRTTNTYTAAGDLATVTDGRGTTTYTWDQSARTMTTAGPAGTTVRTYDPSGTLLSEGDGHGHDTTHVHDAAGREIQTTDPAGTVTDLSYDVEGNVVRTSTSAGASVVRQFDSLNRAIREIADGVETRATYDAAGNLTSTTDASGAVTRTSYDDHGNVVAVATALGTTRYDYHDASDLLLSTTDPELHETTYTYDAARRRTSATTGGATTRYGYDLAGNLATTTDPDGRRTAVTSDARKLPVTTVHSQPGQPTLTVQTSYDTAGRRTKMVDATGTHDYAYDSAGNMVSATGPDGRFTYDYGTPGAVTETYPDGTAVHYAVDDTQHVMSLESGTPGTAGHVQASYVRDGARRTTALAYSNGVLETRSLDARGDVVDQQLRNGDGALADDAFTYDAAGNRLTQRTTVGGTTTASAYGYDRTGRLTSFRTASGPGTLTGATVPVATGGTADLDASATIAGGPSVTPAFGVSSAVDPAVGGSATTYAYDGVGNRLVTGGTGGRVTTTYDSADRVTGQTGAGNPLWTYDKAGNLTRTGGKRFAYDAAGRLVRVTTGTSTVTYTYDGDGNRVSKTVGSSVTRYVWDVAGALPLLVLERTGSGDLLRRYFYGDGPVALQTPTATYFFHLDPIGSVADLTDGDGKIVAAYHYDAFGTVTTAGANPPANPLLFQGQYLDGDTGLYDMRARQYDPTTGRFTQRDPQERAVGAPAESAYVFASDRPTVFTDPTGRVPVSADAFLSHANTETNAAATSKLGVTGITAGVKVVSKVGGYSAAVTKAAAAGAAATPELVAAAKIGQNLATAGKVLTVVGLALQVFVMVEDCLTEDAYTCAGAVVGTAVSLAFTAACSVVSGGVAAFACGVAGAALSIGLQYVITHFGPDIVAGVVAGAGIVAKGVVDLAEQVGAFATDAAGAIVSGFDTATTAISSGFDQAVSTLTDAGYRAAALADVLAHSFEQGLDQAVGVLVGLGYRLGDIATSVVDVFEATATQFAGVLKNGFDYAATQISAALSSAYDATAAVAAQALADVGFAVDEVAGALKSTYALAADAAAAVLDGVGYAYGQVAAALDTVFAQTDQAVAAVLAGLDATATEVGAALRDFYSDADAAAAAALAFAAYTASQIAGALRSAYASAAQTVAGILDGLDTGVAELAGALKDVFDTVDVQAALILRTLGHTVTEVAGALQSAYSEAAQGVSSALRTVGYAAVEVGTALQSTFQLAAADAAQVLQTIGFDVTSVGLALKDVFAQTAAGVAATLSGIGYQIADVTGVLATDFLLGAAAAAGVLDDIFTTDAVALVLVSAFGQTVQQVAQVFKDLGYGASALASMLRNTFAQGASAAATVLKNIGVAAADIADVLQNVFGQAVSAVASLLSSIGFSNDTINAIGGAFASFGKKVKDCFTSFFTNC